MMLPAIRNYIFPLFHFKEHPFRIAVTLQKIKSYEYLCVILKKIARKTNNLKYEKNNKFPFVIRKVNPDFELLTNNLDKNALKKIIFDNK
jgi:hypothetical protein